MDNLKKLLTVHRVEDVFKCFEEAAHKLIQHWCIERGGECYEILELEFFLYSQQLAHLDPYVYQSPTQQTFGHWLYHLGGAEITMGEANRYGSIQIRAVRRRSDGICFNGPQRVFRLLFEDGGDVTLPSGLPVLKHLDVARSHSILAAPRVGLNLTEFSDNMESRIDYILRPYRFISEENTDFADKYFSFLFAEKVSGMPIDIGDCHTVYNKYLHAFDTGYHSSSLDVVWEERSKLLRMARLLGRQVRAKEVIQPILSNDVPASP